MWPNFGLQDTMQTVLSTKHMLSHISICCCRIIIVWSLKDSAAVHSCSL